MCLGTHTRRARVDIHMHSHTHTHTSARRRTHSGAHGSTEPAAATEPHASRSSVPAPRAQAPERGGRSGCKRDEGDCWSLIKRDAQRQARKTHCKRHSAELRTPVLQGNAGLTKHFREKENIRNEGADGS